MRKNFTISSQEIKDKIFIAQENMIYLLGYREDDTIVSGLYDELEQSGINMYTDASGIPNLEAELQNPFIDSETMYKNSLYYNLPKKWRT